MPYMTLKPLYNFNKLTWIFWKPNLMSYLGIHNVFNIKLPKHDTDHVYINVEYKEFQ